jgi:hypothetical protein
MKQYRLMTIGKLLRFLRDYEEVPTRELSKRMACYTLGPLERWPPLDQRCELTAREFLHLPRHENYTAHLG